MRKMKNLAVVIALCIIASSASAQEQEVTTKNSWLKIGVNAGVPVGNHLNDYYSAVAGLELKGQFMTTPHLGIGLTTGYNQFFHNGGKNGVKAENFGTVPVGAFVRYYPESSGFFAGVDGGYSFLTNANDADGGFYVKPQLGYHNYSWNYFAYYNTILRNDTKGGNISNVGVGATYNIRFKK